jgi:sulfonate transport system permease protein
MSRVARFISQRWLSLATIAVILAVWEIAGHLSPKSPLRESPLVPPIEFVFGKALIGLSDYWRIDWLAPNPITGGPRTLLGALLAIGYHSVLTLYRLVLGLVFGAAGGTLLGLAISWSPLLRRLAIAPLHILRMIPLLAMVPLFQFWFGATNASAVIFVAYGVGVVYFIGTINAVANVQSRYVEYALTLGASKLRVYLSVIFPAILPELLSSVMLTLGLAWSAIIGAEYVGVDSGLGRMIIWAEFFSNTGRMALVTLLLILYAGISFLVVRRVAARILSWMPKSA